MVKIGHLTSRRLITAEKRKAKEEKETEKKIKFEKFNKPY